MRGDIVSHREIDHGEWIEHIIRYADGGGLTYSQHKEPEPVDVRPLLLHPGSHYAAAWLKAGLEEQYIDGMKGACGDEW